MNKRWSQMLVWGVLGLLVASPVALVRADEGTSQEMDSGRSHGKSDKGHDALGLSHEQKSKLETVMESEKKALKPFWRKQRDLKNKLEDQVEDQAADSEIKTTLNDIRQNLEAMKKEMEKFRSEREAIFTPIQQAKMTIWRMSHHKRMGHGEWGHEGEHYGHHDGDHFDRAGLSGNQDDDRSDDEESIDSESQAG